MLCWSDIFLLNAPGYWVGGRLGGDGKRVLDGRCGCETTSDCSDLDGCMVQRLWVDGGTMPESTSWLRGRMDEGDGSGRRWRSNKTSPSTPVSCCFCSN